MKKTFTDKGTGRGTVKRPLDTDQIKMHKGKKKITQAQDDAYDRTHGIKEGSKRDIKQDRLNGIVDKKKHKAVKQQAIAHKKATIKAVTKGAMYNGKAC